MVFSTPGSTANLLQTGSGRPFTRLEEPKLVDLFIEQSPLKNDELAIASATAERLVNLLRDGDSFSFLERFLATTRLDSEEGKALMVLAEAVLRTPDADTQLTLIADCLGRTDGAKLAVLFERDSSTLYRLAGRLFPTIANWGGDAEHPVSANLARRLIRQGVKQLGSEFVIGEDIRLAWRHSDLSTGYFYSYDMLGEAAMTSADAERYFQAYRDAIIYIGKQARCDDFRDNPGISVKLSALSPRYQRSQRQRALEEVVPRVVALAQLASQNHLGLTIDAEESDRLELQLDVLERVLAALRTCVSSRWEGLGIAVQAYGLRAPQVIDWLHKQAILFGRKLAVRLVKGAYWDAEIKRAQVLGASRYPVFTSKAATDLSYLYCAGKLFDFADHLYPQFATHNAHTIAAIHGLSLRYPLVGWEYQRLHGMGRSLYDLVRHSVELRTGQSTPPRCRVYAPVGEYEQLLAYLVRRMLENGANASFVHQAANRAYPGNDVTRNPMDSWKERVAVVPSVTELFGAARRNSRGFDLGNEHDLNWLESERDSFIQHVWDDRAGKYRSGRASSAENVEVTDATVIDASMDQRTAGVIALSSQSDVVDAVRAAKVASHSWASESQSVRCDVLNRYADLLEQHTPELLALLAREAGKTLPDAVSEIREAVDFARYYATEAAAASTSANPPIAPVGVVACISPWNFPLAIFSGPVLAALVMGNAVVAKPAEQTPLIAAKAVSLMNQAGLPEDALQMVIGAGETVGEWLLQQPDVKGVCFTGSHATARRIHQNLAAQLLPGTPLVAETGGINAMIVDSTALPEQVVRDVMVSAFQSTGQRCSALRVLYLQEEVADRILDTLKGAMDELVLGDPWQLRSDLGPLIDESAWDRVTGWISAARDRGALLHQARVSTPAQGWFVAPALVAVDGIESVSEEVFGPVLHVARFAANDLDRVIQNINEAGFGLTFAIHSRIPARTRDVVQRVRAGNCYINRNQVGAVVGSQPFGGEGLSGTGPKAGGPGYLQRFGVPLKGEVACPQQTTSLDNESHQLPSCQRIQQALDALSIPDEVTAEQLSGLATLVDRRINVSVLAESGRTRQLPGPTGELNELRCFPRGKVLCVSRSLKAGLELVFAALNGGNAVLWMVTEAVTDSVTTLLNQQRLPLSVLHGQWEPDKEDGTEHPLTQVESVDLVSCSSDVGLDRLRVARMAIALREGAIIPFLVDETRPSLYQLERHVCTDLTAAGGNLSLLSNVR